MRSCLAESVPINSLRLTDPELRQILDRLDKAEAEGEHHSERRADPRLRYRVRHLVVHVNQGGAEVAFVVPSRNISRGGMAFLHRRMLHVDTPCRVQVMLPGGEWLRVTARVVRCQHVNGVLHEIGLQFDKPITLPE